jgi:hypothetical protein
VEVGGLRFEAGSGKVSPDFLDSRGGKKGEDSEKTSALYKPRELFQSLIYTMKIIVDLM